MKAGHGKRKGSQFEREVCVKLSRFIDPNGDETIFWRSSLSGGRATQQFKRGIKNKTQLGDITCVHEKGLWLTEYFYIECKFYADLDLASGLLFGKGQLSKFWDETCDNAEKHEREPMLIARQNNTKTLLIIGKGGLIKINTYTSATADVILKSWGLGKTAECAFVCLFDDMFKTKRSRRK